MVWFSCLVVHAATKAYEKKTIVPHSYFKLVIKLNNKIIAYFMTGLWTEEKTISIPAHAITVG